ncbi:MAG TPA: patatin-like phospholipase family protein [Actinomycetes bacterium]|jgi:NTE family protein|nr:patatin-like phospholipase family protein [Actinomycetes bacterium]
MRVGLVLGAGGLAGEAFHRGVLRAMDDLALDPRAADVIVGTSAGAVVAASLRRYAHARATPPGATPQPGRRLPSQRGLVLDLARRPRQAVNALLLRPEFTTGRLDIGFIVEGLRRTHGMDWPDAELWVVAVRRRDGRRVVFGRPGAPVTDVGSAVAASCAIPAYFTPMEIDGAQYIDGGVHSPTNADLLTGCDLELVVVSSPMSVDLRTARLRVDLPIRLRFQHLLRQETWVLRRRGLRIVRIEPDAPTLEAMGLNMMSARNVDDIEDCAYLHACRRLRAFTSPTVEGEAAPPA